MDQAPISNLPRSLGGRWGFCSLWRLGVGVGLAYRAVRKSASDRTGCGALPWMPALPGSRPRAPPVDLLSPRRSHPMEHETELLPLPFCTRWTHASLVTLYVSACFQKVTCALGDPILQAA